MTDREKLTKILTSEPELLKNLNVSTIKLFRLVDKMIATGVTVQEPLRPIEHKISGCGIKIGNSFWGEGTTVCKCPKCGNFISRLYNYCYKCGQPLDWSDMPEPQKGD